MLGQVNPWLLAGLLYLGAGLGLTLILGLRNCLIQNLPPKTKLSPYDWKWLAGATFLGGVVAPVLLMLGLTKTTAATTSLLLSLESVFTSLAAWIVFKEHASRRIIMGMGWIVLASMILSWSKDLSFDSLMGPLLIAGACLAWAFDNNFSRNISAAPLLKIVSIKSVIAGVTNTCLALLLGVTLSITPFVLSASMVVGFIGYGLSLVCFVLALRLIGTARTSAYFSLAPFVGAGLSIVFLGDAFSWQIVVSGLCMGTGIYVYLTEYHTHAHQHEALVHEHWHIHDEHHQHTHQLTDPPDEPHSHVHRHEPLYHSHPHYPDIHHRHAH